MCLAPVSALKQRANRLRREFGIDKRLIIRCGTKRRAIMPVAPCEDLYGVCFILRVNRTPLRRIMGTHDGPGRQYRAPAGLVIWTKRSASSFRLFSPFRALDRGYDQFL
jgi:hypothetical protein